eukprot:403369012
MKYQIYSDRDKVFNQIKQESDDNFCFVLKINKFNISIDEYEIEVSYPRRRIPDTNKVPYDLEIRKPNFDAFEIYKQAGFMGVYQILMNTILQVKGKLNFQIDIAYMPMMTPSYNSQSSSVTEQLSQNFPFYIMFTYLIPLYYLVSKLSEEKESKLREGMKMMGLKDSSYFASWIVFYMIIITVMSLIIMGVLRINVFPQSNMFLVFIMNFLYGLSLFGFSLVIVAILPTQRSSATAATLLHIISYFLIFALKDPEQSQNLKILASLLPNIGMSFSVFTLYYFESDSTGLNFTNASIINDNISFQIAILTLAFDCVFYLLIGLYLDQVIPSQYGVARKWYFLCSCRYWCGSKRKQIRKDKNKKLKHQYSGFGSINQSEIQDEQEEEELKEQLLGEINSNYKNDDESKIKDTNFEETPEIFKKQEREGLCLKISGLSKKFGKKVAVQNSNITMYNSQIFALLGHNGAGKTTTISMLTGLIKPDRGKSFAFGIDVFDEMDEFRKILGVCPQHDILFEFLTPKEHLRLYAVFKGSHGKEVDEEVEYMLDQLELSHVKHQQARTLSGGQKRKLSVGCAMIGNSKIIILDEPTSGMDTTSRRKLWDMLKQNKQGKIIILTTHYMDEADILGDRIAIMGDGKIKCCGSSLFLKNRYGAGYNLVISKMSRKPAPQVDNFVLNSIMGSIKVQEVSTEIIYQLPLSASRLFKKFFELLDVNLQRLEIRSYGVGITTLEEVFLQIGDSKSTQQNQKNKLNNKYQKKNANELENYSIENQHQEGSFDIFFTQLGALLKKKFILQVRDFRTLVIELIFPIFLIFCGLALASISIFKDGQARQITPAIFPKPNPLFINSPYSDSFYQTYFAPNTTLWSAAQKQVFAFAPNSTNFLSQLTDFDRNLYTTVSSSGQAKFGNYYFYKLNKALKKYAVVTIVNVTSQDAVVAFGHEIHQYILRDILGNLNAKLTVINQPQPYNLVTTSVASAIAGTQSIIIFAIAFMMVSSSLISNIISERKRNVKNQMIISGLNLPAYWISHYLVDLLFQSLPLVAAIVAISVFNLDVNLQN